MDNNLLRKVKVQLLFSPFSADTFISFFNGIKAEEIAKTVPSKKSIERWLYGGTKGDRFTHSLFKIKPIQAYLDESLSENNAVVEQAFYLIDTYFKELNPDFELKVSKKLLLDKYCKLLKNDGLDLDFDYIRRMRNNDQPFYKERLQPEFLNLHLQILDSVLGKPNRETIESKLLEVTDPQSGKKWRYPAIWLYQGDDLHLNNSLDLVKESDAPPEEFVTAVKDAKSKIEDNPTFSLKSLCKQSGELACSTSSYFKALYDCDNHFFNIAGAYPGLTSDKLLAYENNNRTYNWCMSLKRMIVDNDFSHAQHSLGISCLLIYNTIDEGYQALLAKKAPQANGFNDMHVIPAAMFQPVCNNPMKFEKELSFKDQVIREVAEEIFDYPEVSGSLQNNYLRELYGYPEISHLEELFKNGLAEFHVTGLSLDMFRLRPEILTTIIIHDENWAKQQLGEHKAIGNWEAEGRSKGIVSIDLNDSNFFKVCSGELPWFEPLCAPGIACFVSGYNKFKETAIIR
ncbi:hypothetical protein [Pseudoalteromonas rubra]|uniref:Uncharacterized protein n=1 Tax=Pseudoalteromonas rubra TaxID=43658 RepID=A0A5S3WTS7_9GAMM|nr:hypothetical protein [Pseudoalteromonas rubra]TMP32051.1 hypothetical protein CWB98_21940 [Pseudoalteromonas rubra]